MRIPSRSDRVSSPGRIFRPSWRGGTKGDGAFTPASWDDALALVAERLGEIVHRHGGEAVLPWWSAGTQGLIQQSSLDRRFSMRPKTLPIAAERPISPAKKVGAPVPE